MKVAVIIPAAGAGRRFREASGAAGAAAAIRGAALSKLEVDLAGKPVVVRSIGLFTGRREVSQIVVAVNPEEVEDFRLRHGDKLAFHGVTIVPGGARERWETVQKALRAVEADCTHVAVHDAARPLASAALLDRVFAAAAEHAAVIPALPVANTLKRVAKVERPPEEVDPLDAILGDAGREELVKSRVVETVDRRDLVEVQTPQVFEASLLRRAYAQIEAGGVDLARITDDASLVEALGEPVFVVDGESTNLKITRPDDARLAGALLTQIEQSQAKETARKRLFGDDDD